VLCYYTAGERAEVVLGIEEGVTSRYFWLKAT
jgi:hypothetical protein